MRESGKEWVQKHVELQLVEGSAGGNGVNAVPMGDPKIGETAAECRRPDLPGPPIMKTLFEDV